MENNTGIENTDTTTDGTIEDEMEMTESGQISEEIEAADEMAADSMTAPAEEKKAAAAPAYEAFLSGLRAHARSLGLAEKDQKGFFQFSNAATGHKLYVAKQTKGVTRVDTTLPMDVIGEGALALEKPNGRIACQVRAEADAVAAALELLASYGEKIPSPKRQAKAAAPAAQ